MEVNFFQRRKILKKSNALDLVPVRLLNYEEREEGKLNILLPRFRRPWLSRYLAPLNKEAFIRIKLDEFGSSAWLMIDGKKNVKEIADELEKEYPKRLDPPEETVDRVNTFMSVLYQQRFISFQQLQKPAG